MDKRKLKPKSPKSPQQPSAKVATPAKTISRASSLSRVPSAPNLPKKQQMQNQECSTEQRCQKRFEHLIHKHQIKNEQLERREDRLLHRLEMLQCSMPVMLAQVCQQPDGLLQLLERQFGQNDEEEGNACRITPSRHYDCRVREVEAQRKEACRRAEEARALWQEREAALQNQKARVQLARQQQQERRQRVEQLAAEARQLQQQQSKEIEKEGWPTGSEVSLSSSDLECLRQLENLVEVESCKRRHVSELEAQNEMYMRVFARAEQQAQSSASRNAELALSKQLEACRAELNKYKNVKKSEASVGSSATKLVHKNAQAIPKCVSRQTSARIKSPKPSSSEQASEAQVDIQSKITWTEVETATKDVEARVESQSASVGRMYSEASKAVLVKPNASDKKSQAKAKVATLALGEDIGQLNEPTKCDCAKDSNVDNQVGRKLSRLELQKSSTKVADETGLLKIPRADIETCLAIVNDMRGKLAGCEDFPHVCKDFQNLKNIFASTLGLDIHSVEQLTSNYGKKEQPCDSLFFAVKDETKEKALKFRQEKQDACIDTCSMRKSERGEQTDAVAMSTCKCEPAEQKSATTMTAMRRQIRDQACSPDRQKKTIGTGQEARVEMKADGAVVRDKKPQKIRQADVDAPACSDEKRKDKKLQDLSKIDKQKSAHVSQAYDPIVEAKMLMGTYEEQRKQKENASPRKSEKPKTKDDVATQKCKDGKCNDIVAALTSRHGKEGTPAPQVKCNKFKQREDKVESTPVCKGDISSLRQPDRTLVSKREKMKKIAEASAAHKDKVRSADNLSPAKKKLDSSKISAKTSTGLSSPKDSKTTSGHKEAVSKAKAAYNKKEQELRNSSGSATAQPSGSEKKLSRDCESKKSLRTTAQRCQSSKTSIRLCGEKRKSVTSGKCRPGSAVSLRSSKLSSLVAADKISAKSSLKSIKPLKSNKSKQSWMSCDKSLNEHPDGKKETGSEQVEGKSPNQLDPSENVKGDDKQASELLDGCLTGRMMLPEDQVKSEYFECNCDFTPAPTFPLFVAEDKPGPDKTRPSMEELCICEPLVKIVDKKWAREAAPGKLYCGHQKERRGQMQQRTRRRRRRAHPRACRHHPYKRTTSSTCLGRMRTYTKCVCSGVNTSPSMSGLVKKPRRAGELCRRCGAKISASRTILCGLLLAQAEQQQQVISQESPQSDIACPEEKETETETETECCGKRDQGVLAKLPKPPKTHEKHSSKKKKHKHTEQRLLSPNRKAAHIIDVLTAADFQMPARNVGPSCTCLKNQCFCHVSELY